ncbi:MAG: YfhO family protein [Candidatus Marinimicrobia bacterium]|nr:YfhO family protein [Candidatus Neomarinimicrobiota bacterium]
MTDKKVKISAWESLSPKKTLLIALIILAIPVLIMYAEFIFEGVRPFGVDSIASIAGTHQYLEWEKESGERALWNPSYFCGMPTYHRLTPPLFHLDTLVSYLGKVIYLYFWYLLLGGFGMFILLYYRKIPWYAALIVAIGFILLPHWQSLIHVGHYSKLRAFMVMPWLILSFQHLVEKRQWISVGFFALIFSWMVRTQHIQVVFYGILILLFLYIVPFFQPLFKKEYRKFLDLLLKFVVGVTLTIMISAQPFFSLQEYTPHSTRGGNSLKIGEEKVSAAQAKGVDLEYATRWSLAPKEILNFFFPRFFGGMSAEKYDGSAIPQLKGQTIPGYWGDMPFTQSYDSMGFLLFLFALLGVLRYHKKGEVRALAIFAVFSILLGFGHHFMPLYKLFFNYFPYFSKFRVPVMIVNMTFISLLILAGYGLKSLFHPSEKKKDFLELYLFGGGIIFILLLLLLRGSFSYMAPGEAGRYPRETLTILQTIRKEILTGELLRAFWVTLFAGVAVTAWRFKKLAKIPLFLIILALVSIELGSITKRAYDQIPLVNRKVMERRQFTESEITRTLEQAPVGYRALVLGQGFQDNYYAYWYPLINGYSAIKLQIIQDAIDYLLFKGSGPTRLNWNVVNMLNGRYIIVPGQLDLPFLEMRAIDRNRQEILYENKNALPKAWLVQHVEKVSTWEEAISLMNQETFDPSNVSYALHWEGEYRGEGEIYLESYTPNTLTFSVDIPEKQFAVISEMFYDEGWRVEFQGKELPILQVNYLLRGVEIPAGQGTLVMTFNPPTYQRALIMCWIGVIIAWLLIGLGFWQRYKNGSELPSDA